MSFSNDFKIVWWFIMLVFLTVLGFSRFDVGAFNSFDVYLLASWFILSLFPIISEVSIFGVSVKKEMESLKNELKSYIATVKTDIQNQLHFQPVINNFSTPVPAKPEEYEKKIKNEVNEEANEAEQEVKRSKGMLLISPNEETIKSSKNERSQERIKKIVQIEKLVAAYLQSLFPNKYQSQMKLEDSISKNKIIVDGLIIGDDNGVKEIIEIKFITPKSFENFYFVANRFIAKVVRLGIRNPVRFVIVSEQMDLDGTNILKNQLNKLNNNRSINPKQPLISGTFFKLESDHIVEVKL